MGDLEGEMHLANSVDEILIALNAWANSILFTTYEMQLGRPTNNLEWLHDVGLRINRATDILRLKIS